MNWYSTTRPKTNDKKRAEPTRYLFEVLEMKINKPTTEFWTMLTIVNVLALIYPINLLLRANSVDENLFATCVLVGSLFLLVVVDARQHRGRGRIRRW